MTHSKEAQTDRLAQDMIPALLVVLIVARVAYVAYS
jgi:hypothetical protein